LDSEKNLMEGLKSFKKSISKRYTLTKVILFGSQVTGKNRADSDVDLVIVSPNFKDVKFYKRPVDLYDDWKINYPVDFLCYTTEEFAEKSKQITIVREAVKNGITI
jgi:uncharacterized protein